MSETFLGKYLTAKTFFVALDEVKVINVCVETVYFTRQ